MKITDPDVIKNGEKDLIDAVKDDLDLDTIKEIMKNKMDTKTISSKGGEIVVHNNEIAFRLDFSIEISGSLMFDRQGNYIPESNDIVEPEDLVSHDLDPEEQLEISLPDYDSDDESDLEKGLEDIAQDDDVDNESKINKPEIDDTLSIDDLDLITDEQETNLNDEIDPETDLEPDSESGTENGELIHDNIVDDNIVDDDIDDDDMNDILKESRDFWKLKKDE
jgi:hypothetical protein